MFAKFHGAEYVALQRRAHNLRCGWCLRQECVCSTSNSLQRWFLGAVELIQDGSAAQFDVVQQSQCPQGIGQKDVKPTRSNRHYCSDNAVGFPDHFPRGSYKLGGVARLGGSIYHHWESSEGNRYSTGLERPPVGPHSPSSELLVFRC